MGDKIVIRDLMNLSLSFDHRVIDGFDAAQFVAEIKRSLETPAPLAAEGAEAMAAPKTIPLSLDRPLRPQLVGAARAGRDGRRRRSPRSKPGPTRTTGARPASSVLRNVDRNGNRSTAQALPAFEPAVLRDAVRAMLRARALDAAARELVKRERIGSYAETTGTEAAVVGAVAALSPDDVVAPGRREPGAALAPRISGRWPRARSSSATRTIWRSGRRLPGCPVVPRALNVLPASSTPPRSSRTRRASPGPPRCRRSRPSRSPLFEAIEVDAEDFHTGVNFAAVFRLPAIFVCINDGQVEVRL